MIFYGRGLGASGVYQYRVSRDQDVSVFVTLARIAL